MYVLTYAQVVQIVSGHVPALIDLLRRLARRLKHLPDRRLHGLRHRLTLAHLSRRDPPRYALMICHGNICRSPYAAAALRRLLPTGFEMRIDSAGFAGPGRAAPPEAVAVAAARGVDVSQHRSKLLAPHEIRAADLIVVMDAGQRRAVIELHGRKRRDVLVLGDLDPGSIETRAITDPVNQSHAVFEASYTRIDRCLRELVRVTTASRRAPYPASRRR